MARHKNALKIKERSSIIGVLSNNCGNDCHSFGSLEAKLKWCFNEGHRPICLQFEVELDVQPCLRDTIRLFKRDFLLERNKVFGDPNHLLQSFSPDLSLLLDMNFWRQLSVALKITLTQKRFKMSLVPKMTRVWKLCCFLTNCCLLLLMGGVKKGPNWSIHGTTAAEQISENSFYSI